MMEEELIRIWQSSANQERVKFQKSRLIIDLQSSLDRMHRALRYRDLREYIAIAIGLPVFAYYVYEVPYLLSKIASLLIILWGVYVVIRLKKARKHKPGSFSENYRQYLLKTRAYMQVQKQLLDNVVYWYILPGFLLVTLFLLGPIGEPGKLQGTAKILFGNIILAVVIYYLNKRAVKTQFVPRLKKLDELINVLEQD